MTQFQGSITVYGTTWCPDCRRAKQFLGEHRVPYQWVDIEDDITAMRYVETINKGNRSVPTIVFSDGDVMVEPSNQQLADKLGIKPHTQKLFYDVIIVGGGPAGLTAAIYTSRDGLDTLVIDEAGIGGQAAITQVLDNFPGFEQGISGEKFAERLGQQAQRFGTEIIQGERIKYIQRVGQYIVAVSDNNREYTARAILISTGSRYRHLNVPGEYELVGQQVHFCATCDGAFYKGKDEVLVIGGGNSGFEEGLFLTNFAKHVTILEREPEPRASKILQDKVAEKEAAGIMKVLTNREVQELRVTDDNSLEEVSVKHRETGALESYKPDGVFVFVGLSPNTSFLPEDIQRDQYGFVKTDQIFQTTMPGVFAAGDVRAGSTKQAVSAAGEGTTAALMIRQYLQSLGEARDSESIEAETFGEWA